MGDYYATGSGGGVYVPSEVLLDGHGITGVECARDAICPLAVVWIAVVRVEQGLIVVQEIEMRVGILCDGGRDGRFGHRPFEC